MSVTRKRRIGLDGSLSAVHARLVSKYWRRWLAFFNPTSSLLVQICISAVVLLLQFHTPPLVHSVYQQIILLNYRLQHVLTALTQPKKAGQLWLSVDSRTGQHVEP